jgi:hypothetical protein
MDYYATPPKSEMRQIKRSVDHVAGGGPRSCDLGTKQLTRLSRSGGAVGREGASLDDARALVGG